MQVKATRIKSKIPDEDLMGLTLAFFSACIKANKSNKSAPLTHFFRERLQRREHRAALNQVLNTLSQAVGGDSRQIAIGSILTEKPSRVPVRLVAYKGKPAGLPRPADGFMYVVNECDPYPQVLEMPKAIFELLDEEEEDHLDSLVSLGYSYETFSGFWNGGLSTAAVESNIHNFRRLRQRALKRLGITDLD